VSATLAAGLTPVPVLHHPCVTLSASSLSVLIDTGICDVTATQVDVVAHARAPDSCPGEWAEGTGLQACISWVKELS
jgi:hypothetical protein